MEGLKLTGVIGFQDFWQLYPRKLSRLAAQRAWRKVHASELTALFAGLEAWKAYWEAEGTEAKFKPYPATWLNQRRWEDAPVPERSLSKGEQRTLRNFQAVVTYFSGGTPEVVAITRPALQAGSEQRRLPDMGDGAGRNRASKG